MEGISVIGNGTPYTSFGLQYFALTWWIHFCYYLPHGKVYYPLFWQNLNIRHSGMFVLRVVKIGQLVFEKMVHKFRQCFFYYCFVNIHFDKIWISYTHWRSTLANWCLYFLYHHPFEKDVTRHLNKLECPLCHVWLELTLWLWSRNYLFLEKDMTLTWTVINFLHLRMLCAKFG